MNATIGALLDDEGKLMVLPTAARVVHEVPTEEWAAYAPIAGSPDFLVAVADDLLSAVPALRATAIATATPGGSGALRHAISNYLELGQALLTTNYHWSPYGTLADESGRRLETFSMFAADGSFDVEALDRAVARQIAEQGRVLLVINDPCHNPTGYTMRAAEWRRVVDTLLRRGAEAPVTLLVDVAYAAFSADDTWAGLSELVPLLGKVGLLFAWTASKSLTHYGLRVGSLIACVADPEERKATDAAFAYSSRGTWSNCNRGGLRAITQLLKVPELAAAVRQERAKYKELLLARVAAFNAAAKPKGLNYPRYEGGFFVTVFTDEAPAKAARLREEGVFVVPIPGALRIALSSVAEREIPRLVDAIAKVTR